VRFLALDQSSTACGFALVDDEGTHTNKLGLEMPGALLLAGTFFGRGDTDLERIFFITSKIRSFVIEQKVEQLIIEAHIYKTMHDINSVEALAMCTGLIRFIADDLNLPDPVRIAVQTVKSKVCGKGVKAVNRTKEAVRIKTCEYWNLMASKVTDLNTSDALGIAQSWMMR